MSVDYRTGQNLFPFAVAPTYRLQEIEDILRKTQVVGKDGLSRRTLHEMCESGVFEATLTSVGYVVKQSSFWHWMEQFRVELPKAA